MFLRASVLSAVALISSIVLATDPFGTKMSAATGNVKVGVKINPPAGTDADGDKISGTAVAFSVEPIAKFTSVEGPYTGANVTAILIEVGGTLVCEEEYLGGGAEWDEENLFAGQVPPPELPAISFPIAGPAIRFAATHFPDGDDVEIFCRIEYELTGPYPVGVYEEHTITLQAHNRLAAWGVSDEFWDEGIVEGWPILFNNQTMQAAMDMLVENGISAFEVANHTRAASGVFQDESDIESALLTFSSVFFLAHGNNSGVWASEEEPTGTPSVTWSEWSTNRSNGWDFSQHAKHHLGFAYACETVDQGETALNASMPFAMTTGSAWGGFSTEVAMLCVEYTGTNFETQVGPASLVNHWNFLNLKLLDGLSLDEAIAAANLKFRPMHGLTPTGMEIMGDELSTLYFVYLSVTERTNAGTSQKKLWYFPEKVD